MERCIFLLLLCLISISIIEFCFGQGNATLSCIPEERQALLSFKEGLKDTSNRLSSWTGEDCCSWMGISCNDYNTRRNVVGIDLSTPKGANSQLGGVINPSLIDLKHLSYLDLSRNNFEGIPIPKFFGSLRTLTYLSLSNALFTGVIPHELANLTSLYHLDLSGNFYFTDLREAENLQWLPSLSSLRYLDLSQANLSKATDWLEAINRLPSLVELRLSSCELYRLPSLTNVNLTSLRVLVLSQNNFKSLPEWLFRFHDLVSLDLRFNDFQGSVPPTLKNFSSLEFLDLSSNRFNSTVSDCLYNTTNLKHLDLSYNELQGTISTLICNLTSLEYLNLEWNHFSGSIPDKLENLKNLSGLYLGYNLFTGSIPMSIGALPSLRELWLPNNELNGTIPQSIGQLSRLETLYIEHNSFEGVVTETHFANLTALTVLDASWNSLVMNLSAGWVPPFQARLLHLGSCELGPKFPAWLQTQVNLRELDISSARISDNMPTWFWNMSSDITYLNLSNNGIKGKLPTLFHTGSRDITHLIYLRSNQFDGPIPRITGYIVEFDISNNSLSGDISLLLCNPPDEVNYLQNLVLSDNSLSGELPQCWLPWKFLKQLQLNNNNLTGSIPSSMGFLINLESLHLGNNSFYGELPSSLQNCSKLRTFDLGENGLSGSIPAWIGMALTKLLILRLRSNKFNGGIPSQLCNLNSLQVLDLANNNLSGNIPRCISNFSAMAISQNSTNVIYYSLIGGEFVETLLILVKGIEIEYSNNLRLATNMDFSCNNLSGEVPGELTSLLGLLWLNMSNNFLTGTIPQTIGSMGSLESLDFSKNKLSGVIPRSMTGLNFLSNLNLSYNNLSGEIPSSTQLQSFSKFSYIGNTALSGPPLDEKCRRNETSNSPYDRDGIGHKHGYPIVIDSFYVSMALGFFVGSWGLCCVLVFSKSLRSSYLHFVDGIVDRLCTLIF